MASGRSEETSLRNPAALGFLRRSIGTGNPSQSMDALHATSRVAQRPWMPLQL